MNVCDRPTRKRPGRRAGLALVAAMLAAISATPSPAPGQQKQSAPTDAGREANAADRERSADGESASHEQATQAELAKRIQSKLSELQAIREQRSRAREAHQQKLSGIEQQVDRMQRDLKRVQDQLDKLEQKNQKQSDRLQQIRERRDRARSLIEAASKAAAPVAQSMQGRIKRGVPFERERRLKAPLDKAEGMMAVFGFAGQELQRGRSIELANRPVTIEPGKQRKHAYVLRLGLAGGAFVSEDRSSFGLPAVAGDQPWRMDLDEAQQRRLSEAIAIRREEAAPALTALPWPLWQREPSNTASDDPKATATIDTDADKSGGAD